MTDEIFNDRMNELVATIKQGLGEITDALTRQTAVSAVSPTIDHDLFAGNKTLKGRD